MPCGIYIVQWDGIIIEQLKIMNVSYVTLYINYNQCFINSVFIQK